MGYFRWLYNGIKETLKIFREREFVLGLIISLLMVFNLWCGIVSSVCFFSGQILWGSIFAMATIIVLFFWLYLLYIGKN